MVYYTMSDITNHSNNYNNEEHNTYEDAEQLFNVKRISIPIDKIRDFIQLLYGEQDIFITRNVVSDNYLDLTNRNVIVL
jgi:hypothetical protein